MIISHKAGSKVHLGTRGECPICNPPPLTAEENEMATMLVSNGWQRSDAETEARQALADAAVEDGYDGP